MVKMVAEWSKGLRNSEKWLRNRENGGGMVKTVAEWWKWLRKGEHGCRMVEVVAES